MRYLGNKTKLLPFILRTLDRLAIPAGTAVDPFAGTASVAAALKRRGWRVRAGDLMACSYALQVARVALDRAPDFPSALVDGEAEAGDERVSYVRLLAELEGEAAEGEAGFVTMHYTPGGRPGRRHGRMYFTPENGRRIDEVRRRIAAWEEEGRIDGQRAQLLIATLIEAADRVANTTGVYASFVKSWQPNALRPLELRPLRPVRPGNGSGRCTAFRGAATDLLGRVGAADLVYLDPPYNGRQYPGYYHIPELLAEGWDPPPPLRGKTGLIPDDERRSDWCRRGEAEAALERALEAIDARHVLFSYNDEGLLDRETIEAALRGRGRPDTYRLFVRPYRRYRSDADGPDRTYRRDRVREHLHYVRT